MHARTEPTDQPVPDSAGGAYVFPVSHAQQRLWFLEQLEGPGPAYNVRLPVRLKGRLDADCLRRALNLVVARHETLRTTFGTRGAEPVQLVAPRLALALDVQDFSGASEEALRHALGQLAARPFDLRRGPLLRAHLLSVADTDHVLLLVSHHIVSDAWSSGVLFRDLGIAYGALLKGGAPAWAELPIQYADFAAWQREWLQGPELLRQAGFWQRHLDGAPTVLELPTDRPRPALQSYRGSRHTHRLDAAFSSALKQFAVAEGMTPFMVLLAAFNALLARWCGQADVVVGTPIAGRRRSELEGLIGFFANTLALRTQVDPQASFRALLGEVRGTALAAFAHQDLPFEKLVEILNPPRSLSHAPIFQVMFILQNTPWEAEDFAGLAVAPAEIGPGESARYDLTLSVSDYEGCLWLGLEYSTDLFDAGTVVGLACCYETLLRSALARPDRALHELAWLPNAERTRVVEVFNDTRAPCPDGDVYGLIAASVTRYPDAIAVECGEASLTYARLDAEVAHFSAVLQAAGATPGSPVALLLSRDIGMVVAVLASLRAGLPFVPLDPSHPPARLRFILADSGAEVLVAAPGHAAALPGFAGRVITPPHPVGAASAAISSSLADTPSTAASRPDTPPATAEYGGLPPGGDAGRAAAAQIGDSYRFPEGQGVANSPGKSVTVPEFRDPAYLIYTSGSTGQPKGVVVPHGAVLNFLRSMAREPGLAAGERLLAVTTLGFDIALLELLLPLAVGGTTVIATRAEVEDPALLMERLHASRISVLQATPSLWRQLVASDWAGTPGLRAFCGGEALDPALASELRSRCAELWNLYGPTETTIWSTCARVVEGPVTVGRPIANTRCYVLDEFGEPVPVGVHGELWIGGRGVALGYHRRPELSAECFTADPLDPLPCARRYRTSDRARWLADGRLQVLGRSDFQFKLRGFRIEPGEIEAAVLTHPGVEAAVLTPREVAGDPRLVAYVVTVHPAPTPAVLAEHLRARLPAYMLPAHWVFLPALPLTPSGKVDRQALPAPGATPAPAPSREPTPREAALAGIFAGLLGLPAVGLEEDFFALGGHSLLATRLLARIRADLGVDLPLKAVFATPTVAGLAAALPEGARVAADPLPGAPVMRAPASVVQQRLWFLHRLEPGSTVYHLAWVFRVRGRPDAARLQVALDALVARHQILHTRFVEEDGEPWQVADLPRSILLRAGRYTPEAVHELAEAPLDLARGPLLRVALLDEGAASAVLAIVLHHIIADGWSLGIFLRELAALYAAAPGGDAGLPPLPLQYAQYAAWQRGVLADGATAGETLTPQIAYWRGQLAGAPACLDLPADRLRPRLPTHRGARLGGVLPAAGLAGLHSLARAEGATLFMVLLAGFDVVLARYAGTEDVSVGTPVAGRGRTELEGLIGFFVNTLVLRTDLSGNPSFREIVGRVKAMALAAHAHAEVPFEKLVEVLNPPRATSHTPLFQVLFNLHNEPAAALALSEFTLEPLGLPRRTAKFDLSVSLAETQQGLAISFEYSTDLFDAQTMACLLRSYLEVLEAVTTDPDRRLSSLCLGPAPDPVGAPSGATPVSGTPSTAGAHPDAPPATGNLVSAFLAQVERDPGALAVSAPGTGGAPGVDWRYAELAAEAGRIAGALRTAGVRPGDRVGLWFGQGAGQVAAMLGVLWAGGCYVPLDPRAPDARLAQVVRDAGLRVVVSEAPVAGWLAASGLTLIDRLAGATGPAPPPAADAQALAYLLYTSGSTGKPKGVPQPHAHVLAQVGAWARKLALSPADRLSLVSTYGYDAALQDVFGALLTGASVHPLDVRALDRELLLDRIAGSGLSVFHATPTVYRYLFGGHVACRQDLSALRLVVLGGEAARRADLELFKARFRRGARLVNGYGLTEATAVLQSIADHDTRVLGNVLPVGRPVGDQQVWLLDDAGEVAGVQGEIVVESASVTPGYWRGEADPSIRAGAKRRWRTGDLGRYLPDGSLLWVGRKDRQVKLGGIRIDPDEIEVALGDAVTEVAVQVVEPEPGLPELVAVYAPVVAAEADLRALARARLPEAMRPARYVAVEALPRRPNGKLDLQALAVLALSPQARNGRSPTGLPPFATAAPSTAGSRPDTPPATAEYGGLPPGGDAGRAPAAALGEDEMEVVLRSLWCELLRRNSIGPDDDFFALGGHSLLATRLIARLRDRLEVELPLLRIFETPTIRGLAEAVRQLRARPGARQAGVIPRRHPR